MSNEFMFLSLQNRMHITITHYTTYWLTGQPVNRLTNLIGQLVNWAIGQ